MSDAVSLRNPQRTIWGTVLGLALAGCLLIYLRAHAFALPLETDECNYAYIGQRLLSGDRLYVDVWDHQPPGVFLLFAAIQQCFGSEPFVFRCTAVVFSLVSMLLIFSITARAVGRAAGVGAALLFSLVSSDPGTAGEGCNREIYMNTLVLLAWWLALPRIQQSGERTDSPRTLTTTNLRVFLAGASLAVASLIKTNIAAYWAALALVLIIDRIRQRTDSDNQYAIVSAAKTLVLFGLAPAALWSITFAYFALTNRWTEFIDAVFYVNISYADRPESFLTRFISFFRPERHPFIFDSAWPLWIGLALSAAWFAMRAAFVRFALSNYLLALILGGYIALCLPAQFWPHYYYLLIPTGVIAFTVFCRDFALFIVHRIVGNSHSIVNPRAVPHIDQHRTAHASSWLPFALVFLACAYLQYRDYLAAAPLAITEKRYNSRDFWGRAQGHNVARVTQLGDSVLVYGNDASIYYYADRRCASRFTMITGLRESFRGAQQRREQLLHDLRANPPAVILLLFDLPPFPEWKAFLDEHYQPQPIGVDFHDHKRQPIMLVLGRKGREFPNINWDWDRSEID